MTTSSTIAYIANRPGLDSQALLSAAAAQWRAAGVKAVGVLAQDNETAGMCSAGSLHDLASGGDAAAIAQWWNAVRPGP